MVYAAADGQESSTAKGAQFELWAQDAAGHNTGPMIYQSPPLTKYPYDGCHDKEKCYSPGATSLTASCSGGCTGEYLAIKFVNNKRNMQLLLPMTIFINEIAWGLPFLLLAGLFSAFYIGGGLAMGLRGGGGGGAGAISILMVHPHYRKWMELAALCYDGVLFASRKAGVGGLGGAGSRYTPVPGAATEPSRSSSKKRSSGGGAQGSPKKDKEKASKKSSGGKKEKKEKKDKADKEEQGGGGGGVAAPTPASAPNSAPALAGTASAGGGRWVHVPN